MGGQPETIRGGGRMLGAGRGARPLPDVAALTAASKAALKVETASCNRDARPLPDGCGTEAGTDRIAHSCTDGDEAEE